MDVEKPERYEGEESPMDTGAPSGVHPNSDAPDPEVVEQAEAESGDRDAARGHGPSRD